MTLRALIFAIAMLFSAAVMAQETPAPTPAPIAAPAPKQPVPEWLQYPEKNQHTEVVALATRHMDAPEIRQWASAHVAEIMSFENAGMAEHFKAVKPYFNPYGWQDFSVYIKESGLITTLKQKNYILSGIVDSEPGIIKEGVVDDTYRWLLSLPLMISFFPDTPNSNKVEAVATGLFVAQVQVGRITPTDQNPEGLLIESWNVTQRP